MSQPVQKTLALSDWDVLNAFFQQALECNPIERQQLLEKLKLESPEMAAELTSLLLAHENADEFLQKPPLKISEGENQNAIEGAPGFTIKRTLGEGAFGVVYLAQQVSLDREVALKRTKNLGQEGRTMALFSHPNIVQVYSEETDPQRELRLICMQYVSGPSLAKLLEYAKDSRGLNGKKYLALVDQLREGEATFDPTASATRAKLAEYDSHELVCWMAIQLLEGLAYAHSKGIVHLDVKPGNILITPYGVPMLTDFNTSMSHASIAQGEVASFGGTYDYMAPEQKSVFWSPDPSQAIRTLDARADVYSVGVLLDEFMATAHLRSDSNLFTHLKALIAKARQESPAARFTSSEAMLEAFKGAFELSLVEKSLPPLEKWLNFSVTKPLLGILVCSLVPQLMGSVVNILYNLSQIVVTFNLEQRQAFEQVALYYNAIVYIPGICIWIWQLTRIKRALSYTNGKFVDGRLMSKLRGHTLQLPYWMALICTLGWLPGAIFFPSMIGWRTGELPLSTYSHFAISFVLSWLVSMSYSFLYLEYLSLRVIYPRLWIGATEIRKTAQIELRKLASASRYFHLLIGILPLAGACLMLFFYESSESESRIKAFHHLSIFLIVLGMGGILFGFRSIHQLSRTLYALMGTEKNK